MFFVSRPTADLVQHFLAGQESAQFSYPDVGKSRDGLGPRRYVRDHNRVQIGSGIETFERAKVAIREWKMFALPWVQLYWPGLPIRVGTNVAIVISHFGFWSLNAARIVYLLEEHGACERYGFAYGTLREHGESGEERFSVEYHAEDDSVWYDLLAFSRPNLAARLAYPFTRRLQKRFAKESMTAMKAHVEAR